MPTKPTDTEQFFASLALFDHELDQQKPLDHDVDVDAFVDAAFGNATLPPT